MIPISTPDLSDEAPEVCALELQLGNYGQIRQFGGAVVTIKCHEDNSLVKQCVEEPGLGRVIVVDGGGSMRRALSVCRHWAVVRSRLKSAAWGSVISTFTSAAWTSRRVIIFTLTITG